MSGMVPYRALLWLSHGHYDPYLLNKSSFLQVCLVVTYTKKPLKKPTEYRLMDFPRLPFAL